MALTTNNTTLVDGVKTAVFHITGNYTSLLGNETDAIKIDASTLIPPPTNLKIMRVWYSNSAPGSFLEFDGATDGMACALPDNDSGYMDYRSVGGLRNNAVTPTQDITLTTAGVIAVGDGYSLVIEISKT